MKRILARETIDKVGKKIKLAGWVNNKRDHGKIIFFDLKDRSGTVQVVILGSNKEVFEKAKEAHIGSAIKLEGKVKKRPEKLVNKELFTGEIEIETQKIEILSNIEEELPIDISKKELNLTLESLLRFRNLALKNDKIKAIFFVFQEVLVNYAEFLRKDGFMEIKTPKIISTASESGANVFKIKYFDRDAFLAQSPQFYKQMGVGIFERVFEIGPVFRAEPHFTSRHINEYISLDAEMGFIESFEEIMDELEKIIWQIMEKIGEKCSKELALYDAKVPKRKKIPRIKLGEALKILEKEYGKKTMEFDIDPEGERLISEYAQKKWGSEFIFLTHYPRAKRPFYTMPSKENPEETESFDLIFRGVEIATGGQRIHKYKQLMDSAIEFGVETKNIASYLENFKYGIPPHGGWGMGSERITQKILGLKSVKEAVLYPRDVKRLEP